MVPELRLSAYYFIPLHESLHFLFLEDHRFSPEQAFHHGEPIIKYHG